MAERLKAFVSKTKVGLKNHHQFKSDFFLHFRIWAKSHTEPYDNHWIGSVVDYSYANDIVYV